MRPIVAIKKTLLCVALCCAAYFSVEFKGDTIFRQRSLANIEIHDSELKPTSGFVVLGMHHSGTSMMSGLLVEGFGYKTGGPLMQATADNETGYFELWPAVHQNQVFLYDQMQVRDAWNHPHIDSFNHEIAIQRALDSELDVTNLRNVAEQLNDAENSPWLLKDPRLCITFPSWLPFLNSKPAVVFTYRNPLSVAQSLNKRDGLPLTDGLRLWIIYNKAAIQNSAHMCRVTTSNNAILQDPFNEVLRISNELTSKCNVPPPPGQLSVETVDSFIDPTLQHNRAGRKLQEERTLHEKLVIEVYNDCNIYEYPIGELDPSWKQKEMDMYLKAMRFHCDLESGVAYNADYVWPNVHEKVKTVKVFYNVYTSDSSQDHIEASQNIVDEQMKLILPFHKVLVRYIGTKIDIKNSETLRLDQEGDEKGTLELLYKHCKENPEDTVTYIHNKGSFHPSDANDALRKFLTRGALSQDCASLPDTCNVCSSRMSPYPHPHTSGNMWTAKCDYIQKLYDPYEFEERMTNLYKEVSWFSCSNMGCDRYASEHWVHSHPSVKPCDLSDDSRFVWNYSNIPSPDFKIDLKPAPRFDYGTYARIGGGIPATMYDRLREYHILYDEIPDSTWWGWNFYTDAKKVGGSFRPKEYLSEK